MVLVTLPMKKKKTYMKAREEYATPTRNSMRRFYV